MKLYYLNKNQQSNGDYEVHESSCSFLPSVENRIYLGYFATCQEAVNEAKRVRPADKHNINGCYYCSKSCHTT